MVELASTIFRDFETGGVPASGAHKPRKSKIREWGTWLEGRQTGSGLLFGFASSTGDADPGVGLFRLNNAAAASATALYIDDIDASGASVGAVIAGWDDSSNPVRGTLTFKGIDDNALSRTYNVTGSVVDGTGYRKVTIAHVGGNGEFEADAQYVVTFARSGDALPSPTTRAALKAIDTTKDKVANLVGEDFFDFKLGNYTAHIAADPLEGVYVKADAVLASVGAWVRRAGFMVFGLSAAWFGAAPGAAMATNTLGIQSAMNLALFLGGGRTILDVGEYSLGYTSTETYETAGMPVPDQLHYGLLVPSGVILQGQGKNTILKRGTVTSMVVVVVPNGNGSQVRNLRIDGDNTTNPIAGATYGSGSGLIVESTSITEDKETIIDTVWIEDTPGYGIGCEWGNHRGLTLRNIWIDGTGSDGIDIKRMNSGTFDARDIVLDNIHVTNFGRSATDPGGQAGIDLRGFFTASNLHVYGIWGAQAGSGIRMQGGVAADTVIGSHFSSVTNAYVNRSSGGLATTYGIRIGGDSSSLVNAVASGCHVNFWVFETGSSGVLKEPVLSACRSLNAIGYGFDVAASGQGARLTSCSDEGSPIGFYLEGDDTVLLGPVCDNNATTHIEVVAGALRNQILAPVFRNTGTNKIVNAEPGTVIEPREVISSRLTSTFVGTDVATAQPWFGSAQDTLTVPADRSYQIDAVLFISRAAGTTSHTTSLLFGGTATVSRIAYLAEVINPTGNVLSAMSAIRSDVATAVAITAANTSATENIAVRITGMVDFSAGGTFIPQFQFSAAPGGAPSILRQTFFKLTEAGTANQSRRGNVD